MHVVFKYSWMIPSLYHYPHHYYYYSSSLLDLLLGFLIYRLPTVVAPFRFPFHLSIFFQSGAIIRVMVLDHDDPTSSPPRSFLEGLVYGTMSRSMSRPIALANLLLCMIHHAKSR